MNQKCLPLAVSEKPIRIFHNGKEIYTSFLYVNAWNKWYDLLRTEEDWSTLKLEKGDEILFP
jgi:hypothetical protein